MADEVNEVKLQKVPDRLPTYKKAMETQIEVLVKKGNEFIVNFEQKHFDLLPHLDDLKVGERVMIKIVGEVVDKSKKDEKNGLAVSATRLACFSMTRPAK